MAKGKSANTTGNQLEIAVLTVLSNKGFEIEMYRVWEKNPEKYGSELLLKNVPFETIYGHKGNTEFLLISKKYNLYSICRKLSIIVISMDCWTFIRKYGIICQKNRRI